IINNLFNEQFVMELFKKQILPCYPDFVSIKKIKIQPHKEYIWESTYHVVIEFKTIFIVNNGEEVDLPIFCSAHSDEPRENAYDALKYLWNSGFVKGNLTIPRPLFFSKKFNGIFYRGAEGVNLYQFIRNSNLVEVERIVAQAAKWFAKLHSLPVKNAYNFNPENSRIKTVIPGVDHILEKIRNDYPQYSEIYQKAYKVFITNEENFLSSAKKRWLIHGDAHPENVIRMSKKTIALIDFTDICLSDFTRDIGSFFQQIEFMCGRKINSPDFAKRIKNIFLDNYLNNVKIKLDESLQKRIDNYYNWTSMRTATFFLLRAKPEPERAHGLLAKVCSDMKLDCDI
ncbi:MAG: aminoglycoside phosphotransferase family protein, partial [Patescibacteria group bacterium]|nr:aminoglycoside phosphotransferase family protein [Patescibacteria group bacterium]